MKIAVTSSNGKTINRHFGKAETIYVYELKKNSLTYLEKRNISKYCSDNPKHAFRLDAFDKVFKIISDCKTLYTLKIGQVPAQKFRSLGVEVKEAEGSIKAAIGNK